MRAKLRSGKVTSVNELITLNLDIRQFAQDVIERSEGPELVRAFFKAIQGITVLDPAVGSGAFIFAALNVLQPLYDACLDRMQAFVEDAEERGETDARLYADFREELAQIAEHTSREYYVLKSIVINNLYGVDIMEEAVEICKLRLFLKLVAQLERPEEIEPLPDMDFNIRAGNTLVGFTSLDGVRQAMTVTSTGQTRMLSSEQEAELANIERDASVADVLFQKFHAMQAGEGIDEDAFAKAKANVRKWLGELRDKLDCHLARECRIEPDDEDGFESWSLSHQPFHWFVEFHGIMLRGGFDVVIANPPYVEYNTELKAQYEVRGLSTLDCGNLHAFMAERALTLTVAKGRMGFIVPLPSINTARMQPLQRLVKPGGANSVGRSLHIAAFDERPSKLFVGVDQRLIIELFGAAENTPTLHTTGLNRWSQAMRPYLFSTLAYTTHTGDVRSLTTQILNLRDVRIEASMLRRFYSDTPIEAYRTRTPTQELVAYRTAGGRYWKVALNEPFPTESLSNKTAYLREITGAQAAALICSSTFWWYYTVHFDMYNLKDYMIFGFRFSGATSDVLSSLDNLGSALMQDLHLHSEVETILHQTRGEVTSRQFVASRSKPIIDEIDAVLARHYGMTDEELDFIINYDIKYRMGVDSDEGGDQG